MIAGCEGPQARQEQEVLLGGGLALLRGQALGGLEHRRAGGPARVVGAQHRTVGLERLDLSDGVQGSADVELDVDSTEGLEACAEPAGRTTHTLGDGAHPPVRARQHRDDAIGLAELVDAQHDGFVAVDRHRSIVDPRTDGAGNLTPVDTPEVENKPGKTIMIGLEPYWLRRALFVIFAGVIIFEIVHWGWESLGHFAFLILLAWLIAISFDPIVTWLAGKGMRRGAATGIVLGVVGLMCVAFIGVFGQLMVSQLTMLIQNLPDFIKQVINWINDVFKTNFDPTKLNELLNLTPQQIAQWAQSWAGGLFGIVSGAFGFAFELLTVVVFSFYLSADAPRIKRTIAGWMPHHRQRVFITVWDISVKKAGGFVISKLALALLSAFFHCIFFAIIGVPYWLPMGIFAGIVGQFIPTIGTYIGIILPAIFAAFNDPWDVVWIVIFATIYQQVENYVFTPKISHATMDVHSGIALAAVFIGAGLFGPIGAIIGIPLVAIALAIINTYVNRYELAPDLAERSAKGGFGDSRKKPKKNNEVELGPTTD